ncbi:hypothetical protein AVEN_93863-1 [Araneus ventricosus]|uniref:DNA helicase Pif1-like 2B domain-containing protein n=1 Tax=Araneus ventricosus TaxID=182803 RepID=A0A4Y2AYI3_ARAVE|nr:hypothetical protein AVEN_93863-1 [Araneus ventricosus]
MLPSAIGLPHLTIFQKRKFGKFVYEAVDDIVSDDPNDRLTFPVEFLNSLTPTGIPLYKLNLKPGCIVMLLRNLAPTKDLYNGTRLILTKLQRNIIEAKRIGSENGETYFIPRIPLIPSDSNMPFKFKRKQVSSSFGL